MTFSKLYPGSEVLEEKIVFNGVYALSVLFKNYVMQKYKRFDFGIISFQFDSLVNSGNFSVSHDYTQVVQFHTRISDYYIHGPVFLS